MPRFESNAARKLSDADEKEISKVRLRPVQEPEDLSDADVHPADQPEPVELTEADVHPASPKNLTNEDVRTATVDDLPELPSSVLEESEADESERKTVRTLNKEIGESIKRQEALRQKGAARRREIIAEAAKARSAEEAEAAGLRAAIARGRASAAEPEVPIPQEPERAKEQGRFLTKAQAYERITRRFGEISNEHKYYTSLRQNKMTKEALAELDAESRELSEWMERVNRTPAGERVENPFFEADWIAAKSEEDKRRAEQQVIARELNSHEALHNLYESLTQRYGEIESGLQGLDAAERGIIDDIKRITELTSVARETLRLKRADALASLIGERFPAAEAKIAGLEDLSRKGMRALGYPEMFDAIQAGRDHLEAQKADIIRQYHQYLAGAERIQ